MALEDAGPVFPLLVAEDWAVEAPESPEVARGSMVALMLPPSPPLAVVAAMVSPPLTRTSPDKLVPPTEIVGAPGWEAAGGPESPETADGSEMALEEAGPVAPVLVAEDWAVEAPELPEAATGSMVALMPPPLPPLAEPLAMVSPPLTRTSPDKLLPPT